MWENEAQELGERLSRIRLPVKELARRAKCDERTIANHTSGRRSMGERIRRDVVSCVVSEELALLDHLSRLHPERARQLAGLPEAA